MVGTPQTWTDGAAGGTPMSAARFNNMETRITAAAPALTTVTQQSGTAYTLVLADVGTTVEMTNAAAVTLTVPPNVLPVGSTTIIRQFGTGQVTVTAGGGVTVRSRDGARKTAGQFSAIALTARAANDVVLDGDAVV